MAEISTLIIESFKNIAKDMDQTRASPEAVLTYDLLADAIAWSDEYPIDNARLDPICSIRVLLRYRTTILLGNPDETFKRYWDQALTMFPNWAGFRPERSISTPALVEYYESEKKLGDRSVARLDKMLRRWCGTHGEQHTKDVGGT